ncbi:CidA/LrgA family protein [Stappia stellulata]|uniref:CidA/LrgA family protein n=1 Tax=Stappia stellulata TaxID=71235 RepID=UPI0003F8D19C|nr:CidA/LrgA family protein [Stappia stellulata]
MLGALTIILCCQLAGEAIVVATGLPVPGPVLGMVFLFAGLVVRGGPSAGLAQAGDALLRNLALLFVPAGVGVVLHLGLLGREGLAISVSLVVSTLATIAVTALVMRWTLRGRDGDSDVDAAPSGGAGDGA